MCLSCYDLVSYLCVVGLICDVVMRLFCWVLSCLWVLVVVSLLRVVVRLFVCVCV